MLKKRVKQLSLLCVLMLISAEPATQPADQHITASGLTIIEQYQPTEPLTAQPGDTVWVHYTGRLQSNQQKFDSSFDHQPPAPISFVLGTHQVLKGWDEGLAGMKVGEKRQLIIPPDLGYGEKGTPGGPIPPNATLIFDVELIGISHPQK